jgi:hypothetical protein
MQEKGMMQKVENNYLINVEVINYLGRKATYPSYVNE